MKVGFIGLGRMGQGIAGCILKAGYDLAVYNRTPEKTKEIVDAGATFAGSLSELAGGREVIVSILAHDQALDDVLTQEGGLLQSMSKGAIHVACGTHGVMAVRSAAARHEAHGQLFIHAPVLGRPDVAAAGKLGVIPAGPRAARDTVRPLIQSFGAHLYEPGDDPAQAAAMKLTNNYILGCAMEVIGEGMSLVRKYGVDPKLYYEVMTGTMFNCPAYKIYGDIIATEDWGRVGITATLGLKDCNLAMEAAQAVGVPLPSGGVWRDRLVGAQAFGDGEKDWAVVARVQYRACNLE